MNENERHHGLRLNVHGLIFDKAKCKSIVELNAIRAKIEILKRC